MKIAHIADIQIRFGSRHEEYREVFKRLINDLIKIKPDRIVVAGDINHHKINISPGSFDLCSELLIGLARIAPTDVILGNHDMNLQQLEQGDSISPIFNISKLIQEDDKKIAYIVSNENKHEIDFSQNAVYYYPDSGFYRLNPKLEYGVFSMKDDKIIKLEKKEAGVNYVALFHGQIFGSRGDNGHILQGDDLVRLSTFNNFDIVMLGDIHEYQTFREDESMAYCGSLIQQDYGESIDKGYLLWDIESRKHIRKFVPNDYGFAKLTLAKGEKFEERIEHLKFSNNKKKTKISIVWEDLEENFSQEKENQMVKLVKDKFGSEIVKVQFEAVGKNVYVSEEEKIEKEETKESEAYLKEFLTEGDFECTEEELLELLKFHRETNKILEIDEKEVERSEWYLNKIEISNVFSFPIKPTIIEFDELSGLTGVFGKNGHGKSNFLKALVWALYEEILGGSHQKFLVNLYTDSNRGYAKLWITIDGQKYFIERTVKTTIKRDGSTSNSYSVKYKKLEFEYDENGDLDNEKWKDEESDEKTREKDEVRKLIENAIGTFNDFTKTSLQTQGGKDDYLQMSQQPKNSLIARYLNLEPYTLRYDFRNETFKDIKKKQKELGDKIAVEDIIRNLEKEKDIKLKDYNETVKEKETNSLNKEKIDQEILELTKRLEKIEPVAINDSTTVLKFIHTYTEESKNINSEIIELEKWISKNFKKELPFDGSISLESLVDSLKSEETNKTKEEADLSTGELWLKNNVEKNIIDTTEIEKDIDNIKESIVHLEAQSKTYAGKKCPTCGTIHQKADPIKEEECLDDITRQKELLQYKQNIIKENNDNKNHNSKVTLAIGKINLLKQSLKNREDKIISIKEKIELLNSSQDIIKHNKEVEEKSLLLTQKKNKFNLNNKEVEKLEDNLKKLESNAIKLENNNLIEIEIKNKSEMSKEYKIVLFNLEKQCSNLFADIKVIESNITVQTKKLIDITEYEKMYRKYSIYLQAMHRDGIPALIIRKKVPLINHRINTILEQVVKFKINLEVLANGDVVETFYYSEDKSDMLPLSSASGAQRFISTIAIKDSFHFISKLPKPSLSIIDEGFGTLDDDLTFEIMNILNYLKNKHKNVIVISHRNEIKDFANNIIEATKVKSGIPQEILDKNPDAGITKLTKL